MCYFIQFTDVHKYLSLCFGLVGSRAKYRSSQQCFSLHLSFCLLLNRPCSYVVSGNKCCTCCEKATFWRRWLCRWFMKEVLTWDRIIKLIQKGDTDDSWEWEWMERERDPIKTISNEVFTKVVTLIYSLWIWRLITKAEYLSTTDTIV